MDAATEAGARGGTIINARGSGIHETSKLFAMEIEPEKEIVLIISEVAQAESITSAIREKMKIDEPAASYSRRRYPMPSAFTELPDSESCQQVCRPAAAPCCPA